MFMFTGKAKITIEAPITYCYVTHPHYFKVAYNSAKFNASLVVLISLDEKEPKFSSLSYNFSTLEGKDPIFTQFSITHTGNVIDFNVSKNNEIRSFFIREATGINQMNSAFIKLISGLSSQMDRVVFPDETGSKTYVESLIQDFNTQVNKLYNSLKSDKNNITIVDMAIFNQVLNSIFTRFNDEISNLNKLQSKSAFKI